VSAIVQSFKDLNQVKLTAMIVTAVVLLGFFAYVALRTTSPSMSPLFSAVPVEDGAKIIAELDKQNIPYKVRANGTQILVPSEQVDKLRLTMASQGLPSQGSVVGYEIFDKSNTLGTPNFILNINQVRALEGELSRTIQGFNTVEAARVHLVMPAHELFSREKKDPTASVALKLKGAAGLSKNEVAAIRHLVATAVPGLKPQRVTIVDSQGKLLAKGQDKDSDASVMTEESDNYRLEYETHLRNTIERLLEQSVGLGKVKAEVHADIDFDRIVINREKYDPEGQVARSTQSVSENEKSSEPGNSSTVSAGNNLPAAAANKDAAAGGASSNRNRVEETTNFEINKEVTNSIKESGNVKKLSVAVLVDGVYTADAEGKQIYAARAAEEIKQLEKLVQSAIGFDATRGDNVSVINMQFAAPATTDAFATSPLDWIKDDMSSIIQTLVLGGVAIIAILMVIRPLVSRAIESVDQANRDEAMEAAALAAPSIAARLTDQSSESSDGDGDEEEMVNIDRIQGKLKSSTYAKINGLVDKHPEETAQIIRAWLSGT
jgi:flagellar M-ring protein FliF